MRIQISPPVYIYIYYIYILYIGKYKVQILKQTMVIYSRLLLLLSNAVTLRRDKSILFSRVAITILLVSFLLSVESLDMRYLEKGVGLYGGLFHITANTQIFHMFIFLISAVILQLTAFYPRKIWSLQHSSLNKLLFNEFIYFKTKNKIINK